MTKDSKVFYQILRDFSDSLSTKAESCQFQYDTFIQDSLEYVSGLLMSKTKN